MLSPHGNPPPFSAQLWAGLFAFLFYTCHNNPDCSHKVENIYKNFSGVKLTPEKFGLNFFTLSLRWSQSKYQKNQIHLSHNNELLHSNIFPVFHDAKYIPYEKRGF